MEYKRKWVHPTGYIGDDGKRHTVRIYAVWHQMVGRCTNPKNDKYSYYGARGITVCEEWLSYDNFYEWAYDNGYDNTASFGECTLDRIDFEGNYEPSNCRFISIAEQQRNRCNNVKVNGKCISEISRELGGSKSLVGTRLSYGYSIEQASSISKADMKRLRVENISKSNTRIFIEGKSLKDLAETFEIPYKTIKYRYHKGGCRTLEELTKPVKAQNVRICKEGLTLKEISVLYKIAYPTLSFRWGKGARTLEELTRPLDNRGRYKRGK